MASFNKRGVDWNWEAHLGEPGRARLDALRGAESEVEAQVEALELRLGTIRGEQETIVAAATALARRAGDRKAPFTLSRLEMEQQVPAEMEGTPQERLLETSRRMSDLSSTILFAVERSVKMRNCTPSQADDISRSLKSLKECVLVSNGAGVEAGHDGLLQSAQATLDMDETIQAAVSLSAYSDRTSVGSVMGDMGEAVLACAPAPSPRP